MGRIFKAIQEGHDKIHSWNLPYSQGGYDKDHPDDGPRNVTIPATQPSGGYDCSSFVSALYHYAGTKLGNSDLTYFVRSGNTSTSGMESALNSLPGKWQYYSVDSFPKANLKPGDLLLRNDGTSGHVEMVWSKGGTTICGYRGWTSSINCQIVALNNYSTYEWVLHYPDDDFILSAWSDTPDFGLTSSLGGVGNPLSGGTGWSTDANKMVYGINRP